MILRTHWIPGIAGSGGRDQKNSTIVVCRYQEKIYFRCRRAKIPVQATSTMTTIPGRIGICVGKEVAEIPGVNVAETCRPVQPVLMV
jgi:hypothetical protein